MTGSIVNKVRLFPLLIGVAALALALRMVDIYSGVSLIGATALAQETEGNQNAEATGAETAQGQPAIPTQEQERRAPIVVGLPDNEIFFNCFR